ncbi:MAG: HAMP domain-containing histidine kinase [Spirochaetales bacterium]|nr:HAMP domain-containing histidine kinase [Spirochaetales bacterium]
MFKKMRWRMILIAMISIFTVMAILVSMITAGTYMVSTDREDQTLEGILEYEASWNVANQFFSFPFSSFQRTYDLEISYMTRFYAVRFDRYGNVGTILMNYIASVDEEQAVASAQKVLSKGRTSGNTGNYRYMVKTDGSDTVVAFLNISREKAFIRTLLAISTLIAFGALIIAFVIVFLLSRRAVRPFVQNLEQQKRFITDVSHELKTPLTSINASLDVIEMESGESDEWHDNIRKQTNRLTKMVGELVTLSRLNEVNPFPNRENISISDVAWEVVEAFKAQAKAKGCNLQADIAEDMAITGDRSAIQQMLSALLDNAVKYSTENGDICLSLSRKGSKAIIDISNPCNYDVPPDTSKLFDRFYRPDESRSASTGGTGVGMAIAKSVVDAHGGKISAECPDGKRMTVHIIL